MRRFTLLVNGVMNKTRLVSNLCNELGGEISPASSCDEFVSFEFSDDKEDFVYNIVSANILEEFITKTLLRLINKCYDYFNKTDKYEIFKLTLKYIRNDKTDNKYRLDFVKDKLKEFLKHSDTVNVQGFVNFRLNDLEDELEEIMEEIVQDYLLEIEYAEFIRMLRFFVSVQKSKYSIVEVSFSDGIFIFGDGKDITKECIECFDEDFVHCDTIDDFLLNSLITIAPDKIIFNQNKNYINADFKKTLLGVFDKKINFVTE